MVDIADLRGPWASWGALGAPELVLGGLGGVPETRSPHLEAPRRGLGTDFGDPKESAYAPNTHIYNVF